jgi:hypothetical protein
VGQYIEVMDPAIVSKSPDPLAGKLQAEPAMGNVFSVRTGPDLALGTARMHIQKVGPAALAGEPL